MPAAIVMGAATLYSASQQRKGASKAASAQQAGQQSAIDEQRRQYDQTRGDLNPYMQFGQSAIPGLSKLNSGDYSGFLQSPDYLAAMSQGMGQMDKSAAARGSLFSGGHQRDLSQFNQANAAQYLGNYRNSLFQQAGMGQNAAAGLGSLGAQSANQIGSAYGNMGNAKAQGYQNRADTNSQLAGSLGGIFSNYMGQRNGSSYGGR